MYQHLVTEKGKVCSDERFRKELRAEKVSFARLGSGEYEACKAYHMQVTACDDHGTCCACQEHASHLDRAEKALLPSTLETDKGRRSFQSSRTKFVPSPRG